MVVLSSTEAKYVALTLATKDATWMRLLLTKIGLLNKNGQYAIIKVVKSLGIKQIKTNIARQEREVVNNLSSIAFLTINTISIALIPMSLKGDNQGSITLAHHPIFYTYTKHIDIQHHYISDEMALGKIDLQYIPTSEMIANRLTKAFT